jgi:hypothetical protein
MEFAFGFFTDFARQALRVPVRVRAGEVVSPKGVSR